MTVINRSKRRVKDPTSKLISAEHYYDNQAENYDKACYYTESTGYYPANWYRLELTKKIIEQRISPGSTVLDAGCGTGEILVHLLEKGHQASGCDLSQKMIDVGRRKLESRHLTAEITKTSLEDLQMYKSNSFDAVLAMGVFPYIREERDAACLAEIHRVLRPKGLFVSAHENELFDLFTFNKYTLRFFERNIYPLLRQVAPTASLKKLKSQMATLIRNPEEPKSVDPLKAPRDVIFTKPENPLTYGDKIKALGFELERLEYYHFHALPPLLRNGDRQLMQMSKQMEGRFSASWQGAFLASTFIAISHKMG